MNKSLLIVLICYEETVLQVMLGEGKLVIKIGGNDFCPGSPCVSKNINFNNFLRF